MDAHERFMNHPTAEVSFWMNSYSTVSDLNRFLKTLIDIFNSAASNQSYNSETVPAIKTLHSILCRLYQERNYDEENFNLKVKRYCLTEAFRKLNIDTFLSSTGPRKLNTELLPIVFDILISRMVLFDDLESVLEYFRILQQSIHSHHFLNSDIDFVYFQLTDCFIDSFLILKMGSAINRLTIEEVGDKFLLNLKCWLKFNNKDERKLLPLFLKKTSNVMNSDQIVTQIWRTILTLGYYSLDDILSMLYLTNDTWFPITSDNVKNLIDQVMEEPFWLLIEEGLSSRRFNLRNQALHLVRTAFDFIEKHMRDQGLSLDWDQYEKIGPLISKKHREKLFSIFETLESHEVHRVTPVFPILKSMLNEILEQEDADSGLIHIAWIRCAYLQVVQHPNTSVVKQGLLEIFTLDLKLYDDHFIKIILETLNKTDLYQDDVIADKPTIVKALIELLDSAERKNSDLITRIMVIVSETTWKPMALFYIIRALSAVNQVGTVWKEDQLKAIKSLAEIVLTIKSQILRNACQIRLLEAVMNFATESLDLMVVADTLLTFFSGQALTRGQSCWKRISVWISKIVTEVEARDFIQYRCSGMMSLLPTDSYDVESISLIIILCQDAHPALNSNLCPGFRNLRELLRHLILGKSDQYIHTQYETTSIEFIGYLLKNISAEDCIIRELIFEHAKKILKSIYTILRNIPNAISFHDIRIYVWVIEQFFRVENLIVRKSHVTRYIEKFEMEAWNIIEDAEASSIIRRVFGIKVLNACLQARSMEHRNYRFIAPLYKTYETFAMQLFGDLDEANGYSKDRMITEYYTAVSSVFYEYAKDQPLSEMLSGDIDWINVVSCLTKVDKIHIIFLSIGILSQIFHRRAVAAADVDKFKSALRVCWKSMVKSNECQLAVKEIVELIFSSSFLECRETRDLAIQCTLEIVGNRTMIPEIRFALLKGLSSVKGKYLFDFWDVMRTCLFNERPDICIFENYQQGDQSYVPNMILHTVAGSGVHAVTLLYRMIIEDPTTAVQLLMDIVQKLLPEYQAGYYTHGCNSYLDKVRIMQVLLVIQPIITDDNVQYLYKSMFKSLTLEELKSSTKIMQEWLLIRMYLNSEILRTQIWDLFKQSYEKRMDGLCSVVSIVYHVARLLPSDSQCDFIKLAFEYIMPCCMSKKSNVRLYAQVIVCKLYDLAEKEDYRPVTEKYEEFCRAIKESSINEERSKDINELWNDCYFTHFNPIDDYTLQTIFYELPRLSNVPSYIYILPQMFEKLGFTESSSHPLKLLNSESDMPKIEFSQHMSKSS